MLRWNGGNCQSDLVAGARDRDLAKRICALRVRLAVEASVAMDKTTSDGTRCNIVSAPSPDLAREAGFLAYAVRRALPNEKFRVACSLLNFEAGCDAVDVALDELKRLELRHRI